ESAASHWSADHVHFEWFAAPEQDWPPNQPFEVELKRSGCTYTIPVDKSILHVLREQGVIVPSSCEEGVCGSCEVAVLDGQPQHRDMLLTAEERAANRTMMICVSRADTPRLVLDL